LGRETGLAAFPFIHPLWRNPNASKKRALGKRALRRRYYDNPAFLAILPLPIIEGTVEQQGWVTVL
jgi:hypothetical protein